MFSFLQDSKSSSVTLNAHLIYHFILEFFTSQFLLRELPCLGSRYDINIVGEIGFSYLMPNVHYGL
jgi:hypothetical protein